MEPSQSVENRKQLRKSHEVFAAEAVDFFMKDLQFKRDVVQNYTYMTKPTGDAICTIRYLFRNETRKMCKDLRDYIVIDDNFVNYCKVIKVDGGNRFFYNYLRRVSLILDMASFCYIKGHDFFDIARKYIGTYEYRDIQLFEDKGGWKKFHEVAEFIGSCGDRLNMVMLTEKFSKKPESFIKAVERLTPGYLKEDSSYCECFPYIVEIKRKLLSDDRIRSPEDPESSSSSDGGDQNPPDTSSPPMSSDVARSTYANKSKSAEGELRPSTSREEVTSSKEAKYLGIQTEREDEKAILNYLLRCCSKRKESDRFSESNDSEESTCTSSRSTESEAENVLEYIIIADSSDSDDEIKASSELQLVNLKKERRKSTCVGTGTGQRERATLQSAPTESNVAEDEPHCSDEKLPGPSNEPDEQIVAKEIDTSPDGSVTG